MAEGKYHRLIKDAIYDIAKQSGKHEEVLKETKIQLTHPTSVLMPLVYLPEVHIKTKRSKILIFEILDSQANAFNLIIADIILAFLVDNVTWIFFIVKDEKTSDLVYRLARIIGGRLERGGYYRKRLPEVRVYELRNEDTSGGRLIPILKKFAKEDKWG